MAIFLLAGTRARARVCTRTFACTACVCCVRSWFVLSSKHLAPRRGRAPALFFRGRCRDCTAKLASRLISLVAHPTGTRTRAHTPTHNVTFTLCVCFVLSLAAGVVCQVYVRAQARAQRRFFLSGALSPFPCLCPRTIRVRACVRMRLRCAPFVFSFTAIESMQLCAAKARV